MSTHDDYAFTQARATGPPELHVTQLNSPHCIEAVALEFVVLYRHTMNPEALRPTPVLSGHPDRSLFACPIPSSLTRWPDYCYRCGRRNSKVLERLPGHPWRGAGGWF